MSDVGEPQLPSHTKCGQQNVWSFLNALSLDVGPSFPNTEALMPSIITIVQMEPLKDFCSSLMLVAAESYIDRALPIADIDSQGRQQMSTDNLQAKMIEVEDLEWQLLAGQVAVPQTEAPIGYFAISLPKRDRTGDPRDYRGACCPYTTYWRQHKNNKTWL